MALQRELDRGLADRVGLLDVDLRGDVARGALQVVGDGPVILVVELRLHQLRDHRRDAAELRMAERIAQARVGEELAVGVLARLRTRRRRSSRTSPRTP